MSIRVAGLPENFDKLLQSIKARYPSVAEAGSRVADVLLPRRNIVPERMYEVVETPEFLTAKTFGTYFPKEPIAPDLSDAEIKWLLSARRTPELGGGEYGHVVTPLGSDLAIKYQYGEPKDFYENEANMALQTAELGYGPRLRSATFSPSNPLGGQGGQSVLSLERVPHRPYEELSRQEKRFVDLEKHKLAENMIRGGVLNTDTHEGNVVLNDLTRKVVQLDSGLAREYDPTDFLHLSERLKNITEGLEEAGLEELAYETFDIGLAMLKEIRSNPLSKDNYAEIENFFNRSGNFLLAQNRELPGQSFDSLRATKGMGSTPRMAGGIPEGLLKTLAVTGAALSVPALSTVIADKIAKDRSEADNRLRFAGEGPTPPRGQPGISDLLLGR